jgi:AraC-like DNA-binding protein
MKAEFLLTREKRRELDVVQIANQEYRLHFHSHIEICLVTDGEMEVWINDQRRVLRKGDISVAWSYDAHAYYTPEFSYSISAIIPPHMFEEFLPLLDNRHASSPFLSDPALFECLYKLMKELSECDEELTSKGYIYVILGTLIKNMNFEENPKQSDRRLSSKVLIYLNEHFREKLNLFDVAHALGYSPNHMSYMFKNTMRLTFNQYLALLRLREAVILMREGKKSITDCAFESGFQSLRSFYRAFQTEYGCTPKEFLNEINSETE